MCLGLAPRERLIRSAAAGPGNVLVLLGALTGRDGIGGASVLASAELGEGDEAKRPSVQIGDPFAEKKLLECCLELLDRELLVSLQDLGAAGLTSSASEMASKGGVGLDIDVSKRAAPRAGDGAVRDHGLRVAGADAVRGRARAGRGRCSRSASAGRRSRRRSARSPTRRPVASARRRRGRRRPAGRRCSSTTARCTTSSRPRRSGAAVRARRAGSCPATSPRTRCCSRCCARRTSPRAGRCSSSTTRSSSRALSAGPSTADARRVLGGRLAAELVFRRSRSRSTATAAASRATPGRAPPRRCMNARPTSRASAPSRSA